MATSRGSLCPGEGQRTGRQEVSPGRSEFIPDSESSGARANYGNRRAGPEPLRGSELSTSRCRRLPGRGSPGGLRCPPGKDEDQLCPRGRGVELLPEQL